MHTFTEYVPSLEIKLLRLGKLLGIAVNELAIVGGIVVAVHSRIAPQILQPLA